MRPCNYFQWIINQQSLIPITPMWNWHFQKESPNKKIQNTRESFPSPGWVSRDIFKMSELEYNGYLPRLSKTELGISSSGHQWFMLLYFWYRFTILPCTLLYCSAASAVRSAGEEAVFLVSIPPASPVPTRLGAQWIFNDWLGVRKKQNMYLLITCCVPDTELGTLQNT